ncbi:hypothetical protein JCM17823_08200 [Halorubrum gandharaense]
MDAQRIEDVTEWDARSFADGFDGLRRLADRDFSGAVTNGTAWLFLLNGRIVGVFDGELDAFADASGTAYEAPHDSLPLLFAMQEQGGTPRAQYYTNDTKLSEADEKLTAGGFTGYVELSENVLSGDYYVAYYGGESLSAAYVGNSRRLETGETAFELADEEVGIYTVYEVDLDVHEIPESTGSTSAVAGAGTDAEADEADAGDDESADDESADDEPATNDDAAVDGTPVDDAGTGAEGDAVNDDTVDTDDTDADAGAPEDATPTTADTASAADTDTPRETGDRSSTEEPDDGSSDGTDPRPTTVQSAESADRTASSDGQSSDGQSSDGQSSAGQSSDGQSSAGQSSDGQSSDDRPTDQPTAREQTTTEASKREAGDRSGTTSGIPRPENGASAVDEDVFSEEAEWREAKSIPALDPEKASDAPEERAPETAAGSEASAGGDARNRSAGGKTRQGGATAGSGESSRSATTADESPTPSTPSDANREAVSERPSVQRNELQRRVQRLETELEEAEAARESAASERDEVAEQLESTTAERDRLESELAELREELDSVRTELAEARSQLPDGDRVISSEEALAETNLFVRYASQGGATLEKAHDGGIDREALRENLQLEHHTSFDTEDVLVEGEPFEEFLHGTMEYGFTRWLVEEFPFEVRETGNESALRDLYDALPEVDRAEIGGSVSTTVQENGEEHREQRTFDLVLRDRMGNPLFVADLNDSRDPTEEGTLESLASNGGVIAESNDAFAAAFAVTASFFEPGALETASDAVGGGLLSRGKRKSFVKLSRKRGYHLCLVESRDGGFHLTVPDL